MDSYGIVWISIDSARFVQFGTEKYGKGLKSCKIWH